MTDEQKKILKIAKELNRLYGDDFEAFVKDNISFAGLKLDGLTDQQIEISSSLTEYKNVCVSAGGGIGKTALAALTIIWFLGCHPFSIVPTTAPSAKQLHDVLWSQVSFWLNRCKVQKIFTLIKGKLYVKGFPEWYAVARTVPKDGKNLNDTMAGFHSATGFLLNVVDESCFDPATEILTNNGWRNIDNIEETDLALTKDPASGEAFYAPITDIHKYDHDRDMYEYESRTCNFFLTPGHRVSYKTLDQETGKFSPLKKKEIEDLPISATIYMSKDVFFEEGREDFNLIRVKLKDVKKVQYKGRVWCITVPPHELIYVRRKGQAFWTCNSGVPDPVFTALEGAMTDEKSYIFLISNPVSSGGYYYDTISDPDGKGKDYKVLYFSSKDSPLVDASYAQRIINRFGINSAMYKSKVLGQPISVSDSAVCAPEVFDVLIKTNRTSFVGPVVMSIDIGGGGEGGDKTVFCHREGMSIIRWDEFITTDPDDITMHAMNLFERLYRGKPFTCVVDAGGIGWGPFHTLEKASRGKFTTMGFLGAEKAREPTMYKNRRTEGYHFLQKEMQNLHFPCTPPDRLKKELANLFFNIEDEPITMEPKKKFRSRLGFSPDYSDALMMGIDITNMFTLGSYKITRHASKAMNKLKINQRQEKFGRYKQFIT